MRTRFLGYSALFAAIFASAVYADEPGTLIEAARKGVAKNDSSAAEPNFTKALALLDPADPRYNSTAVEFATYLKNNKMVEKSEPMLRKAAERQQTGPVQAINRIPILMALADTENALRDTAALEDSQIQLVKTWTDALGPDEPVVANNLVRLAQTYERTAKFAEAAKSIQQALPILKKTYGDTDPSVGYAIAILSRAQIRLGDKDGAAASAKSAKEILANTYDPKALAAGGGVTFPKIQKRAEPQYPEQFRKQKIQGSLTMSLVIGEDGVPRDIHILIPLGPAGDTNAIEAVKQWRFEPGMKNDEAVAVRATIDVNIRLF